MSARAQDGYAGDDRIRYEGTAMRCMGCQARGVKENEYVDFPDSARKFGVHRIAH